MNELSTENMFKIKSIMELITKQFNDLVLTDLDYYKKYDIFITNEQMYVDNETREGHDIFVVVKFLAAEINFGQDVIPVTITAVSESNAIEAVQRLLLEYAQLYNQNTLKWDGKLVYQNYSSPYFISHFEVVYDGYRSVASMSGSLLLSSNINRIFLYYYPYEDDEILKVNTLPITNVTETHILLENDNETNFYRHSNNKILTHSEWVALNGDIANLDYQEGYDYVKYLGYIYEWNEEAGQYFLTNYNNTDVLYVLDEGELIEPLNYSDSLDITPDSQPYYNTKNFSQSVNKYGTFSFNIVSYLTQNNLNNTILKITNRKRTINKNFYFKIRFDSGDVIDIRPYKLIHANKQQNIAEMPCVVMVFTN